MNDLFRESILNATGATDLVETETIQSLWSGYGKIARIELVGTEIKTVVLKIVRSPDGGDHPRGWNTNLSHERKLKSYEVEAAWYSRWSDRCAEQCRVPQCFALENQGEGSLMVLEDLDQAGFPIRKSDVSQIEIDACISWLANFHATFMGESPIELWDQGTYWHLDTRPDELEALDDKELKNAASQIDKTLNNSPFKTFVHGDAKLANFCFSRDGASVAAVDFQYVGGGCGMKDVAYFIGSCIHETNCERLEHQLLNTYFGYLKSALTRSGKSIDFDALEANWRSLYPIAWTDFHRFLKGWSPGHWKLNSYSERIASEVLAKLKTSPKHLSQNDLKELAELAIDAAKQAGRIISDRAQKPVTVFKKTGGDSLASQVVTEVDQLCQDLILKTLKPSFERFDLGLLTEESTDNESRHDKDAFWCIDPLDGTLPFIESTPGYAVSISLVSQKGTPLIGVVFDPVESTLYHAIEGEGAFRDHEPWKPDLVPKASLKSLSLIGDRSLAQHARYSEIVSETEAIAHERELDGVHSKLTGSAVMNACWTLENAPACYFKFPKPTDGGGSLWDYAATACIFKEAGAFVSDIYGAPLDLNRSGSTFMNHRGILFATDQELAERIREFHAKIATA
jgi:3'-phosphoadenosine 5'-phosphosulfate (PAPS) 3'-phosphatase/aminoglycoside phosphotransferase (APT) family kinase protein